MQNLSDLIFIDKLPSIDIHGYDSESSILAINDYINEMHKQKISIFTIIHGNGKGILRKVTGDVLLNNKKVLEYKLCYYNTGCTIVKIAI